MNKKLTGIFWGIVLIAGGVYALAQAMGYEVPQDPVIWGFIFGGISIVSLIFYFIDGWKNWSWLFPVGIFGALALMMVFVDQGEDSPAMAAPLFIGIGLPFVVAFIIERKNNWWALIPAGVMAFLTLVVLAVENVGEEWIGSGFMFLIATAFFVVYLTKRAAWAGLVAYIMFVLGFMPLLGMSSLPELAGVVMFLAIGIPFLIMYVRSPERWWAIIPAGILLTLSVVVALTMVLDFSSSGGLDERIGNVIAYGGAAVTLAFVWRRHQKTWAGVFALLAAVMAVVSAFTARSELTAALLVILIGAYLLFNALRPKKALS